jgi:hypothetical protein
MPIIIRKSGPATAPVALIATPATPVVPAPVIAAPVAASAAYESPFKTSAHYEGPKPKSLITSGSAPRQVVKMGGKPVMAAKKPELTEAEKAQLAGLELAPSAPIGYAKWPAVAVGERVRITNSMFPWVKHYRPGDEAVVEMVHPNHNIAYDDPVAYRMHTLRIVTEGPTKDSRTALFRHEFEVVKPGPKLPTQGKIVTVN